jgi:hypothetical protein
LAQLFCSSRLAWLAAFGIAFGYLEAAVVVYLREIYYPEGFGFPLALPDTRLLVVELGRELATLIMLWAVARFAGRNGWDRFGAFCSLFGIWDVVFYAVLWFVLRWPESLLTWDVLFLIPMVWTGPVLTPLLVAVSLIAAGALVMKRAKAGVLPVMRWWIWAGGALSLLLLLGSFMANHWLVRADGTPESFPWIPYAAGLALGWGTYWAACIRLPRAHQLGSAPDESGPDPESAPE